MYNCMYNCLYNYLQVWVGPTPCHGYMRHHVCVWSLRDVGKIVTREKVRDRTF